MVEKAFERTAADPRTADRPSAARGADLSWRGGNRALPVGPEPAASGVGPAGGRHIVHDAARRVSNAALSLHRTGGGPCGFTRVRAQPEGNGKRHRAFRQYGGLAGRSVRQSDLPRIAGASARNSRGRLCARPGAVRETGRRTATGAEPEPRALVSTDVRPRTRAAGIGALARAKAGTTAAGYRHGQI